MKKTFKEKILEYGEKLLAKEKDKYMCGMNSQYDRYSDGLEELKGFYDGSIAEMRLENYRLKSRVKELEDKLWGRN